MAETNQQEKTEPASPKRRAEAREGGKDAKSQEKADHISIVVLPHRSVAVGDERAARAPQPDAATLSEVVAYLDERRLLATKVRVVGPRYLNIAVHLTIVPKEDWNEDVVRRRAASALAAYFDPWTGGDAGSGWRFGRRTGNSFMVEVGLYCREIWRFCTSGSTIWVRASSLCRQSLVRSVLSAIPGTCPA